MSDVLSSEWVDGWLKVTIGDDDDDFHTDEISLAASHEALRAELEEERTVNDSLNGTIVGMEAKIRQLTKERDEARVALEQANNGEVGRIGALKIQVDTLKKRLAEMSASAERSMPAFAKAAVLDRERMRLGDFIENALLAVDQDDLIGLADAVRRGGVFRD